MARSTARTTGPLVAAALLAAAAGCGGSSAGGAARQAPDLAAFLQLPVASPSVCPPNVSGSTVGRRSPWVGHVDVSVFVQPSTPPARLAALRAELTALPAVRTVYVESQAQAHAEFARLYTCSAQVPIAQTPASYRLVLRAVTRPVRDDLVRRILVMPGVETVSCDPSSPCVDVVRQGATPTAP